MLWEDTVAKSPQKARPLVWLGKEYEARGEAVRALELWDRAANFVEKGSSEHGHLLNNLALAQARLKNYDLAVKYYSQAVAMIPNAGPIWANLGVAQMRLGREEEAWKSFDPVDGLIEIAWISPPGMVWSSTFTSAPAEPANSAVSTVKVETLNLCISLLSPIPPNL
jgi:tetratricopeptide (TPR) repeat protein